MVADTYGAGLETLDQWIARLRDSQSLMDAAGYVVAEKLEEIITDNIAKGVDPSGSPWRPTKDGEKPLVNAAKALSTRVLGDYVVATIDGVEAYHHFGTSRTPRRAMLPMGGLPDRFGNVIRLGLVQMSREWLDMHRRDSRTRRRRK